METFPLSKVLPSIPDSVAFRALYDQAVEEINATRDTKLSTEFHAKISNAIFNVGLAALTDCCTNTKRMHTVSAPPGAGKTSFSYALIAALTRYAEANPDGPYGCVYVVDQISRADSVYEELSALLPGKVAVWYTGHDFDRAALKFYPVAVVTHNFFVDVNGHHARSVDRYRDGRFRQRALTIVDEQPEDVKTFEITPSEAQAAREALNDTYPDAKEHFDSLFRFIEPFGYVPANRLYRPGLEVDQKAISDQLEWFATEGAKRIAQSAATKIAGANALFGFAKAMSLGCGFVISGNPVRFVGWESKLIAKLSAGTILLDATANIDGISRLVPWRVDAEVPQARYDNLEIIHVPPLTTKRLSVYLKTAPNQRAYVNWMREIILEHTAAGERVLVVCTKRLFEAERVPDWPDGDERFNDPETYTKRYEWDIEGRKLCAVHWGTGIGSNDYRDANVVILFDEFYIPRRAHVARAQGLLELKAHEGPLGALRTLNSTSTGVNALDLGHRLRWLKQMALRGCARMYDEHGMCGKQRLVVASELQGFLANVSTVFPSAKVRIMRAGESGKWSERVIAILSASTAPVVTTGELGKALGKPWRSVRAAVLTPEFESASEAMGWRYAPGKGRVGGRFQRVASSKALAA
jgi:hypothetical protein